MLLDICSSHIFESFATRIVSGFRSFIKLAPCVIDPGPNLVIRTVPTPIFRRRRRRRATQISANPLTCAKEDTDSCRLRELRANSPLAPKQLFACHCFGFPSWSGKISWLHSLLFVSCRLRGPAQPGFGVRLSRRLRFCDSIWARPAVAVAATMGHHKTDWNYYNSFKYSSVPTSIWITLMFVLSLYMWPKHRQR